jgi:hypothetical protein
VINTIKGTIYLAPNVQRDPRIDQVIDPDRHHLVVGERVDQRADEAVAAARGPLNSGSAQECLVRWLTKAPENLNPAGLLFAQTGVGFPYAVNDRTNGPFTRGKGEILRPLLVPILKGDQRRADPRPAPISDRQQCHTDQSKKSLSRKLSPQFHKLHLLVSPGRAAPLPV